MDRLRLRGARLADPEAGELRAGDLLVEGDRIAARLEPGAPGPTDAAEADLTGAVLAPGLVDLHHHGRAVFAPPDRVAEAVRHDAADLARHGVTAFLVTSVAWSSPRLASFLEETGPALEDPGAGAFPLGIHLEGPWLAPGAAGAQPTDSLRPFDPGSDPGLLDRAEGRVRMVTFAPELPRAVELQEALARRGILGALGHSMTHRHDAERVISAGARHVTHLYNAMSGIHHREPGLAGVALADERLTADLICDGAHVDPGVVRFTARALGERLVLISDRVDPGPGADFGSGPLREAGGAWRLPDGRLAGSSLTLERAVAGARRMAGLALPAAVAAASLRPARLLGLAPERGTLRPGARADLVALDPAGAVRSTWVGGRVVFDARG